MSGPLSVVCAVNTVNTTDSVGENCVQVIACCLKAWLAMGLPAYILNVSQHYLWWICVAETIDADQVGEYELPCYWKFIIGADSSYVQNILISVSTVSVTVAKIVVKETALKNTEPSSVSAVLVGLFFGGVVAGTLGVLLIVGIVVGACRLRRTKHKWVKWL